VKITKVSIANYKSIKKLEFSPNEGLNAFVGGNSTGKSNLFDAINWLLGPTYPSFNSVCSEDRYLGKEENKIKIQLFFDDNSCLELAEEWQTSRGEIKSGLNLNGNYVNDEVRKKYCSAYLGVDRQIVDYMPSNRWSLLGRVLQQINESFKNEKDEAGRLKSGILKKELEKVRDEILFSVQDEGGKEIMKEFISVLQEESAKQLGRDASEFSVDFNLYDPWHFYRTLQILVKEPDIGLSFQASNLGMGVQASISIAILKAYSKISLKNKSLIFIDEPELFLHPQAQRNFYKILRELSENDTQVFYTTHSPEFLSGGYFNEIFLVRKNPDKGTQLYFADVDKFIKDLKIRKGVDSSNAELLLHYRNAYDNTGDSQKANEAFFARKVILVEGSSESLILPYFFELAEFDYIREGITIVRTGSKKELDRFFRLYSEFGIPCYVIFDGDKQLEGTSNEKNNINQNKSLMNLLGNSGENNYPDGEAHNLYLGFEKRIEDALGFEVISEAKGIRLYKIVKKKITKKEELPKWVEGVIERIQLLKQQNVASVLESEPVSEDNDIPF
jgi:putative ATP-dependent endonuclease of OLD family